MNIIGRILTIGICAAFAADAQEIWLTKQYSSVINVDSILTFPHDQTLSLVKQGEEHGSAYYYCVATKDLAYPMSSIEAVVQELSGYRDRFHYCTQSRGIRPEDRSYFFEIGTLMARSWFVGNYRTDKPDTLTTRVALVQNHDAELNNKWKREKRGLINVGYKDFQIAWIIRRIDEKHTRVALVAYVKPDIHIAENLFAHVSGKVYPAFLADLESALSGKTSN